MIRVLTYAAFLDSWGPGPELAASFKARTGTEIQFLNAGDAGLLIKKLELFPADVVIGFDRLNLAQARAGGRWRPVERLTNPRGFDVDGTFVAYDWAPMAFVYRDGEIDPPRSLPDLLDARFRGAIAIEDPRTSTPGLQFFFWVLDEFGVDEGFDFLARLKPNLQSVGASWSQAYGAFTKKRAKLAFSYQTSPVYHWIEEKNRAYRSALFSDAHPAQVEYAAVSDACDNCVAAADFVRFLLEPAAQAVVMRKNFMFPVTPATVGGTPFAELPPATVREWKNLPALLERRDELFARWRELGL